MPEVSNKHLLALLFIAVLGIYYLVIFAPYSMVDDTNMVYGYLDDASFSWKGVFFPGTGGYYRPLLFLTFLFDKEIWMMHESFMHLENVLLHLGNTILVFYITLAVTRWYRDEQPKAAFAAALLFALHPINTEAVNWISGRTDPLAGFFILFALLLLLNSLERQNNLLALLSCGAFFVACLAKETAVFFFPAAVFAVICYDGNSPVSKQGFRPKLLHRIPLYCLISAVPVAYMALRGAAYAELDRGVVRMAQSISSTQQSTLLDKLILVLQTFGFYLKKIFIPWPLNFNIVHVSGYYALLGVLLVGICGYLVWRRDLIAALFAASICLISSAALVSVGKLAWTPFAERYLYIPSATFSIAMVLVLHSICRRRGFVKLPRYGILLVFGIFACSTLTRNMMWLDDFRLFEDSLKQAPDFIDARKNYARALLKQGRKTEGEKLIAEIKKGLRKEKVGMP